MVTAELISRAKNGDEQAFSELIGPYRRELQLHCYRMLGSVHDAEDAVQETMLAAWQGLPGFEQRASIRTWLYKIATSRCLLAQRTKRRRPQTDWPPPGLTLPEASGRTEVTWLEPYPTPSPEEEAEAREGISLAFITALQLLPPRQRAVLVLRDVMGFHANEVAGLLDSTLESVTSALKRARATVRQHSPHREPPPLPGSAAERALIGRLGAAYERGSVTELIALLTDDVTLTMPPIPLEYSGRDLVRKFLAAFVFAPGNNFRVVPVRANGQPALGMYMHGPADSESHANGVMVFTLSGDRVSAMTRFDARVLGHFGLPATLRQAEGR
ncbi:MAG: RNA polymerase subunit sigma-70 [Actinobacteria bacterium]|nr:RNA polymerase subunit sigma-70 [Actinomycetota bacterium]